MEIIEAHRIAVAPPGFHSAVNFSAELHLGESRELMMSVESFTAPKARRSG
jgi:hypothetical protein